MTGLHNRQSFYSFLYKQIVKCYKEDTELSLLAIDIDRFKVINDIFGHPVGDKVLAQVAEILEDNVRSTDYVGRVGGEEFFILLPKTTINNAFCIAERIKRQVEQAELPFDGDEVTISIGISSIKGSHNKQKLLRLADEALYKAKETRNTIWATKC